MAKKRGQGEGTIRKRADGRWEAMLSLGIVDGKPKRISFYGRTRKEVADKLVAAQRELQQGGMVVTERQTVAQFLTRWLDEVIKPYKEPATYRTYAGLVRKHLIPALGHHQLGRLAPQHVQAMLTAKSTGDLAGKPCTLQRLRDVLRNALNQALRWGLVTRNVAALVDPPHYQPPEVQPFTPEEAQAFLVAAKGDRLEALYTVVLAVGLREGEALGLRWEDVDLTKGLIRVRKQVQRIDGKLQLKDIKTAKRKRSRTVSLPPVLLAALRSHRTRQLEERLLAGGRWRDWDLVFPSTIGTPLDARNVLRRFQKLVATAGLPHQRFHDLRHCCASLLLAQGVPPRVVMEILGHSDIRLTMNTYAHVMPVLQREAADLMEAFLTGNTAGASGR
ncbi:MAG TPA: site-specific integrase [Herpetosiphonaceae bacterium]|nr:site-specific integrase [Herpetosiphonaceae bacterium]